MTVEPLLLAAAGPTMAATAFKMLLVLGGMVVTLALASRGLRRLGAGRSVGDGSGLLEIVETRRLDVRRSVHLVRVGEQFFLIGAGDGRLTPLSSGEVDAEAIASLRDAAKTNTASEARRSFLGHSNHGGP